MQYQMLTGTIHEIEDRVNAAMRDGWTPHGGVCYWGENTNESHSQFDYSLFAQAMVKVVDYHLKPGMVIRGNPGERLEGFNPNG